MKISLIIPTRERVEYLEKSVRTALNVKDKDIEIIIQDNFSSDGTGEFIKSLSDDRLRYFNSGKRVSMRENFNLAVKNSTGEYLIIIGDDDGFLPGQFPCLRAIVEEKRPDGISWLSVSYRWPETVRTGKLGVCRLFYDAVLSAPFYYDAKLRNIKALQACDLTELAKSTPSIYHGCVSRAYLERISPEDGVYFDGLIPDINFNYRAVFSGGQFYQVNHPFTIAGDSKASTGGAYLNHEVNRNSGQQFSTENAKDDYSDVFDSRGSIPLVLFSTLETVRTRMKLLDLPVDYSAWFTICLPDCFNGSIHTEHIEQTLKNYAHQIGQTEAFESAATEWKRKQKAQKFGRFFNRKAKKLIRFFNRWKRIRVSAEKNDENNVLTSSQIYDEILGNYFALVQSGQMSKFTAWRHIWRSI